MKLDEIGPWSVHKLEILKAYLPAYAKVLAAQQNSRSYGPKHFGYVDGFAGAGVHIDKTTGDLIDGSPTLALSCDPPFQSYHFIDMNPERVSGLRAMAEKSGRNAIVHEGDCNQILLERVFPNYRFETYRRAICFLDPYGVNLDWKVIEAAGKLGTIEIFLNFPIMDMNRNAKRTSRFDQIDAGTRSRLTRFWGDESWHDAMFPKSETPSLFADDHDLRDKGTNYGLTEAFRKRLREVAGFKFVPEPVAMVNSRGATVYYLFWAGPNAAGNKIASHILSKYRR